MWREGSTGVLPAEAIAPEVEGGEGVREVLRDAGEAGVRGLDADAGVVAGGEEHLVGVRHHDRRPAPDLGRPGGGPMMITGAQWVWGVQIHPPPEIGTSPGDRIA